HSGRIKMSTIARWSLIGLLGAVSACGATPPGYVRAMPPPGKVILARKEIEVPLQLFGKRPVVEIMINRKGPYRFILDTGAGGSVVDEALITELQLPVLPGEVQVGSPGGSPTPGKFVRLERIDLADLSILELTTVSMALVKMLGDADAP